MKPTINTNHKSTARIFEDVGGYFICDDTSDFLDARGTPHASKAEALRAAYQSGYTHAIGSGAYKQGKSIKSQISIPAWMERYHEEAKARA